MNENYVKGKVVVAFKVEAAESDIEKVLAQYEHEKVFKSGEYDGSKGRKNEALNRLYTLAVPAGTEANVVEELKARYEPLVKYAHQPATRGIK